MDLSRLAGKILERVRNFRSSFDWAKTPKKAPKPAKDSSEVYHRKPRKAAAKGKPKKSKSTKGRKTVKK